MNRIRVFLALLQGEIYQQLQYKVFFITFLLTSVIQMLIALSVWGVITNDVQLIAYVFLATLVSFMYKTDVISFMGYYVKSGDIAILLIKPFSLMIRLYVLFISNILIQIVIIVAPTFFLFSIFQKNLLHNFSYFNFACAIFFGMHVYFLYTFLIAQFSIKLTNTWGLIHFDYAVKNFFAGVIIPMSLFPEKIQVVIQYLPFSTFIDSPIRVGMGMVDMSETIFKCCFWTIFLFTSNFICYRCYFMKKTEVLGG